MADRISSDHPTVSTIRAKAVSTPTGWSIEIPPEAVADVTTDTEPTDGGSASDEPTDSGSASDGPTDDEPASNGSADVIPTDDVVRVVCDDVERFARFDLALDDETTILRGVYDSPTHARSPGKGTNRLTDWLESAGIRDGGSVLLDVIEPAFQYGLRAPGTETVYTAKQPPNESLSSIAKDLESNR